METTIYVSLAVGLIAINIIGIAKVKNTERKVRGL